MTRIRSVDRIHAENYLKKAEEYIRTMNGAFEHGDFTACVGNAVHAGIAAADALCVFAKGMRHAGQRHEDAISLFHGIDPQDADIKRNADHLTELLKIKNAAEYGERMMSRSDAEVHRKHAERLVLFVKSRIESR